MERNRIFQSFGSEIAFYHCAHENFIYFISGIEWHGRECEFLNDVDRYDLNTDQWEKLTGLQIARKRLMVLQETGKLSSLAVLRGVHK